MKLMRLFSVVLVCLLVLVHAGETRSFADDALDGFGDDALEGFGDDSVDDFGDDLDGFGDTDDWGTTDSTKQAEKGWSLPFELGGSLSLKSMYNIAHDRPEEGDVDWRGLSALRTELSLKAEGKFFTNYHWYVGGKGSHDFLYGIRSSDEFPEDLIEDREATVELDKAYVGGRVNDYMDFRIGRQVVIWGKSDTIRVVDVINPEDNREPLLIDIAETRLPVTMTKLDFFWGDWTMNAIAIHEIRFDKYPVWGSDFYPTAAPLPYERKPESSFENTELAFSWSRLFTGGGFAFYYANLYNDDFYLESVSPEDPPFYDLHLTYGRANMFGFDCNKALGNLLLKTEMAVWEGLKYFNPAVVEGGELIRSSCPTYNRYDVLFGMEYLGFNDTMISFDIARRVIGGFDSVLENSPLNPLEVEDQWVLRMSRTFKNETVEAELLVSCYGWDGSDGAIQRFTLDYDVTDRLMVGGGIMLYQEGDAIPIETIDDNDRIFLEAVYSF